MMISSEKPKLCGFAALFVLAANGCSDSDAAGKPSSKTQASEHSSDAGWHFPARDAGTMGTTPDGGRKATGAQPAAVGGGSASPRSGAAGAGGASSTACETDEDCDQSRWRCAPAANASGSGTRELTLPVIDSLQLSPLADVRIAACDKTDYECKQPVVVAKTDKDGHAKLTVPATFDGYMQQTERSDFTPALYFAEPPFDGMFENFPLIPASSFDGLALALGTSVNRERGHAMLIVEDCQGAALSGITFTSPQADKDTKQFYIRDQLPTTSAQDTPPEGDGGYVNLPAGMIEITALDKKTGLVLNTVSALIRADAVTTVYIRPAVRGSTTP